MPVPVYPSMAKLENLTGILVPEIHKGARGLPFSWRPEPGEIAEWFGLVLGCQRAIEIDSASWRNVSVRSLPRESLGCLFHDLKEINRKDLLAAGAMIRQLGLLEAASALVLIAERHTLMPGRHGEGAIRGALRRVQRALTGDDPGEIVHLVNADQPVCDAWFRLCVSYQEYFATGGSLVGAVDSGREVRELWGQQG
jgi:hypothetical protein